MRFKVAVKEDVSQQLRDLVSAHAAAEQAWWDAQVQKRVGSGRGRAEREARKQLRQERLQRRAAGQLLGTRQAMLSRATEVVLQGHDWYRRYKPIPAGETAVGRPWGFSPPTDENGTDPEQSFPERLTVELPDKLGEQVKRAAYWESRPAVDELQQWYDAFGDGPRELERNAGLLGRAVWEMGGNKPRAEDLRRRGELRAQVITVGGILRLAIDQALDAFPPPPEPPAAPEPGDHAAWFPYQHQLDRFLAKYTKGWH